MGRVPRTDENIVAIPTNVSVTRKGYVYLNVDTWWGEKAGGGKCAQHTKVLVGIAVNKDDWRSDRRMWANATWWEMFPREEPLPEAPRRSDTVSVGVRAAVDRVSAVTRLRECLELAFGQRAADMLLGLAHYMLSSESAVYQHVSHWARDHATREGVPLSDSAISEFLVRGAVTPESVLLFKRLWARASIGDGRVFLCYDSTNVNSQANGVFIVQKGHAKDDPDLEQVNTEYVVRQSDGMPVTFSDYPGSVNDMAEATEVISFLADLLRGDGGVGAEPGSVAAAAVASALSVTAVTVVADRGYASEQNLRDMLDAGIGFLVLLRRDLKVAKAALARLAPKVRRSENRLADRDGYVASARMPMLSDGTEAWFHVVWESKLESKHRDALYRKVETQERRLRRLVERGEHLTKDELRTLEAHFRVTCREDGTLTRNKRGRGAGGTTEVKAYVVTAFERDHDKITEEDGLCGYYVLASSEEMSGFEAVVAYTRRDCVEKVFRTLKTHLGMDKYGVRTDGAMHVKALAWFCASVIYSAMLSATARLRERDRKRYTGPACINLLEELEVTRDPKTKAYSRRYQPTKAQKDVLGALDIKISDIDAIAAEIK